MSGKVTVTYSTATLSSTSSNIVVGGGSIVLTANSPLELQGTIPFNGLYITETVITLDNPATGASINGTIAFELDAPGGAPTIDASNFSGTVSVNWPQTTGAPGNQPLSPGDALTLSNFQN